jgi:hypothetical protein
MNISISDKIGIFQIAESGNISLAVVQITSFSQAYRSRAKSPAEVIARKFAKTCRGCD